MIMSSPISVSVCQVQVHKKLVGMHRAGKPLDGLFTRCSMKKGDTVYCFLDVKVTRNPKPAHVVYHYGVQLQNGRWMTPRLVSHQDPVFTIKCSQDPNVDIDFKYITCGYARLAEVTVSKDIVIKVRTY